jgi:uncharacterized protein with HEPN domain
VPSRRETAACLADILDNIERIDAYTAGLDRAAFARDDRTRDAVERCLERICEAAVRLGGRAERLMPAQPWADIRGMGNRLRHGYDRINLDVIWSTIRDDLPSVAADVRTALQRVQE